VIFNGPSPSDRLDDYKKHSIQGVLHGWIFARCSVEVQLGESLMRTVEDILFDHFMLAYPSPFLAEVRDAFGLF